MSDGRMENEGVKEGRKEGGRSERGFSWAFKLHLSGIFSGADGSVAMAM